MASRPATKAKTAAAPKTAAKKPGKPLPPLSAAKKPAAKAALVAEPKKIAETVTLRTVFEQIAEGHEMSKKLAHAVATEMVDRVTGILKNGDRVRISGLGIIEVKDLPARTGHNPATGETIQIAARKKVAFRVSKELKVVV
jgi:DNA-binding protein HU-beta